MFQDHGYGIWEDRPYTLKPLYQQFSDRIQQKEITEKKSSIQIRGERERLDKTRNQKLLLRKS